MKNYTKYAFLTLLVATSGISVQAEQIDVAKTTATWRSTLGSWFSTAKQAACTKEGRSQAWQSAKDAASAGWTTTKKALSSVNGWIGTSYNWTSGKLKTAKTAVGRSFTSDKGYGYKAVAGVKAHPCMTAAAVGALAYPVLNRLSNATRGTKVLSLLAAAGSVAFAYKAGVSLPPAIDRYVVASGLAALYGTAFLDTIRPERN